MSLSNNFKCYKYLLKYLPLLTNSNVDKLHYNGKVLMNSFEGKNECGASSYLLYYFIKSNYNLKVKFMKSTFGYGKYKQDHLFLQYDNYLIDPTYKQFLYSSCHNKKYNNFVSRNLPFIFVGYDISKQYKLCQNNYFDITNTKLSDENLVFWKNPVDVTEIYLEKDLNKIIATDTQEKQFLLNSLINEIKQNP